MRLPSRLAHLFWDCDFGVLDSQKHAPFVLSRTMCRMEEFVVSWLRQTYPPEALRSYLFNVGARKLGPRELEYWCAALGVEEALSTQWLAAAWARVPADGPSRTDRPSVL